MTRRWFITGGTPGGFGMAFADAALEAGDQVVLDYWIADQHDLEGAPAQAFIDIIA